MTLKNIGKVFLVILVISVVVLPFYLSKEYFVLASKFLNPDYSKVKSTNGVVSVLVLGKGGKGHEAPDLTDTIISAYINTEDKKISLLSLPRDIWLPELRAKLNSSYYWGKQQTGSGLSLTSESVAGITGIKPEYIVVVDFSIFKELIDTVGGIEVEIDNSFTDNKYPIAGLEDEQCKGEELLPIRKKTYYCRYESITFNRGKQTMNGETALKFVRSRNAESEEGTDLAREARQQKVIAAIKNKMLSSQTFLNPFKLFKLYEIGVSATETNIDLDTAMVLARLALEGSDNIVSLSIPDGFMEVSQNNPRQDYQYVFVPQGGGWQKLQLWLRESL